MHSAMMVLAMRSLPSPPPFNTCWDIHFKLLLQKVIDPYQSMQCFITEHQFLLHENILISLYLVKKALQCSLFIRSLSVNLVCNFTN